MVYFLYYCIFNPILCIFSRSKVRGSERIPKGRAVLCGNHTSMMDPVYIALALYRYGRHTPKIMAKIELSRVPVVSWLVKPIVVFVDRGKADLKAIKTIIQILKNDKQVVIFPEGTRVDVGEDSQAKTGVAMMAMKGEAPIVPFYITEGRKNLFRFPKVEIIFGEAYMPVKEEGLSTSESYRKIVDDLMERIRALKG